MHDAVADTLEPRQLDVILGETREKRRERFAAGACDLILETQHWAVALVEQSEFERRGSGIEDEDGQAVISLRRCRRRPGSPAQRLFLHQTEADERDQ